MVEKLESVEKMGRDTGESGRQIQRYIRLTNLIPEILDMVDDGRIAFRPAVELSYLTEQEQSALYDTMGREDCTPSLAQAIMGRMCDSLSSIAARTAQLVDRLTAERKTPDSRQSVKEALRDLQAEKKYGEDFPAPAEPIR